MAHKVALQSLTGDDNPTKRLTSREFEVIRFLAEGEMLDEIATVSISDRRLFQTIKLASKKSWTCIHLLS
jgi:hypothetical protein